MCPDGSAARAARAVRLRKWLARVVINGCIRDSEEIFKNTVGVKALHTVPKRSAKEGVGERDVPVSFAGPPLPPDTTSTAMLTGL